MLPWIERDEQLRAAYEDGRRAGSEPVHGERSDDARPADGHGLPDGQAAPYAPSQHGGAAPEPIGGGRTVVNAIEEGLKDPGYLEMTWPDAKHAAHELGHAGEELPANMAQHPALRRAHRDGQRAAAGWWHPMTGRV